MCPGVGAALRPRGNENSCVNSWQRLLFALLCGVVLFEGFDTNVISIVLPYVGREFVANPARLGTALSIIAFGAILAFFTIRLSDRFGRRPVILGAIFGFGLFTLATAFAQNLWQLIILQLCVRVCLVTQISTAYILLNETMSANIRGRASGLMAASASVGSALPAMLLEPAIASGFGWRALFVVGALPLAFLPLLWRGLRESEIWLAARESASRPDRANLRTQLRAVLTPQLRWHFLAVSALWFVIAFWSAATFSFLTFYVIEERGWTPRQIQIIAPAALVAAFLGYAIAGVLMDRIGRCRTAALLLGLSAIATALCFRAANAWAIGAGWILLQLALGIWVVGHVITTELFPVDVRASAYGLAHNLIGRWGFVAGPVTVGWLTTSFGAMSNAIVALSVINLLAVPLVLWVLPETRGADLAR